MEAIMADPVLPAPDQSQPEPPRDDENSYAVGYGRPPKKARFKPGQSGNPRGRPKGSQNVKTKLKTIYMAKIRMHVGEKRCRVTWLEALHLKQLERGIKGSERATQAAIANAKALGLLDEVETEDLSHHFRFSDEEIDKLSDQAIHEILAILKARERN
jgi:hypothetical protein